MRRILPVIEPEREPISMKHSTDNEGRTTSTGGAFTGSAEDSIRRLLPLTWPLFTAMWLLFPIGSVLEVLRTDIAPVPLISFLISMAVYVAVYLWLMLRYPFNGAALSSPERRTHLVLLGSLAALALYLELTSGGGIPYHFMFVVIAAAVTLPTRRGLWAVVSVTVVANGLFALRSGWEAVAATWESSVAPFMIVGFSMVIVSRLVVTVRELHEAREEIARLAVAEERLRFARDLHDLLGHSLSSITLKSELASRLLPAHPERAAAEVEDIESLARRSLREVRDAVTDYRQPTLARELEGAREMLRAAGIACRVHGDSESLPAGMDSILAWTVREGVTNVIRHSHAGRCEIRLGSGEQTIRAEIIDDGAGSSPGEAAIGSGLSGLSERIEKRGGDLEALPLSGGGFRLSVSLPVHDGPVPVNGGSTGNGSTGEAGRA